MAPDRSLMPLLELDGTIADIGDGYWIKIIARQIKPNEQRPHGVDYCLTLHDQSGARIFGLDNAHSVKFGSGPARKVVFDHRHDRRKISAYEYTSAEELVQAFWDGVEKVLEKEKVL